MHKKKIKFHSASFAITCMSTYLVRATPTTALNHFPSPKNEKKIMFPPFQHTWQTKKWIPPAPASHQFLLSTPMPLATGREHRKGAGHRQ
jgi:hypothetical protein